MNNKKGFTLFEILIVVVIIAVLGVSGIIAFNKSIKNQNEKKYDILINQIIEATKVYVETSEEALTVIDNLGYMVVYVGNLQEETLLNENLTNPITKEPISPDDYIYISKNVDGKLEYEYNEAE